MLLRFDTTRYRMCFSTYWVFLSQEFVTIFHKWQGLVLQLRELNQNLDKLNSSSNYDLRISPIRWYIPSLRKKFCTWTKASKVSIKEHQNLQNFIWGFGRASFFRNRFFLFFHSAPILRFLDDVICMICHQRIFYLLFSLRSSYGKFLWWDLELSIIIWISPAFPLYEYSVVLLNKSSVPMKT